MIVDTQTPVTIVPGDLVRLDPGAFLYYEFDFDGQLADGVTIDDYDLQVEVYQSNGDADDLAYSSDSKADDDRSVLFILDGRTATEGATYRVSCAITTNESPVRGPRFSFFVLIQRT